MLYPKVIAFYLPQFHKVKENDKWWGEGFTDWVSAKNAKSYYEGHYQPHIPLNDFYYDLTNKETMVWQSRLMRRYRVDGLCFYHYWFENGRMILEKPAENLLKWKDVNMPFCFSWANETWARSWSNIRDKNVWSDILEKKDDRDESSVLLQQSYGGIDEWRKHFEYLLPFFKDDRYIKVNGKPLFLIYRTNLISCLQDMLSLWRKWSVENGLPGIFVLASNCNETAYNCTDGEVLCEPSSVRELIPSGFSGGELRRDSYTGLWNCILSRNELNDRVYYGGFVGYDDTPRRGSEGSVVDDASPQLFGRYLAELFAKNIVNGKDLIFINAWNEWGEGMHLEPDKRYGFEYLEQIGLAKDSYEQYLSYYSYYNNKKGIVGKTEKKHEIYLNDLDCWMRLREQEVSLEDWFLDRGIRSIAIYGYGIMGRHLISELKQSRVSIEYIIDKRINRLKIDIPVYRPNENLPIVDMIVVASYYYYKEIEQSMNGDIPMVSLGDVIHYQNNDKHEG